MKSKKPSGKLPQFSVIAGTCLGHRAFRGYAPLKDLAAISSADIFDQKENPNGTQRNLNVQHARKAYQYVAHKGEAFYPELVLNIRDKSFVSFRPLQSVRGIEFGALEFTKDPRKSNSVVVSRLDGNHRLWFADGHEKDLDPISRTVSFCFLILEDLNQELEVFRDINDNQMGMNTSHLQNITMRLLGKKALKVTDPALYIVQRLQNDKSSPLYQKIHEGGKIRKGATLSGLTYANLKYAIQDMLSRSAKLPQFPDTDAQYGIIRNYWIAVREWLPDAWSRPGDYIIFRGVGLYAISYLGIEIIDRCLLKGKYQPGDMLVYLAKLPQPDVFTKKSNIALAGRGGARKMVGDLIVDLEEEGEVSLSRLQKMILGSA